MQHGRAADQEQARAAGDFEQPVQTLQRDADQIGIVQRDFRSDLILPAKVGCVAG
jgi:hypothetical protein